MLHNLNYRFISVDKNCQGILPLCFRLNKVSFVDIPIYDYIIPPAHIAPLARFVDLYDYICGIIGYISTFIVGNESTINVGNKSWRYIFLWISYNIFPQIQAITKIQPIKQQILLYCTSSSETTRFVDFIGKKPTNIGIILTITITIS